MYATPQRSSRLFSLVFPGNANATQSNIPQAPLVSQPSVVPQTYSSQITVPQVQQIPQVAMVPQVQSVVPTVQSVVPTVQSVVPTVQSVAPTVMPKTSVLGIAPYVLPIGSRLPLPQDHMGKIPDYLNFKNIGGSPYGRISAIQ